MLKSETLVFGIQRDGINLLILSIFSSRCCLSLVGYNRLLVEKI